MRAIVQDGYGSAEVFRLTDLPTPVPNAGEVLVQVRAAGLDRGTWHVMTGRPYAARLALGLRRQRQPVPGLDVAGVVAAVGPGVTEFALGDEVFGFGRGSFAEYTIVPVAKLAHKPARVGFEQAAIVPVSGSTALQAVRDAGRLASGQGERSDGKLTQGERSDGKSTQGERSDGKLTQGERSDGSSKQRVLVHGASGGVGGYAVQIAKALGAEVTGVGRTDKLDLLRGLGADHVIDYTTTDFAATGERYDLIIDTGGDPSLRRLRRALTDRGTAVVVGGEQGHEWNAGLGRMIHALVLSPFVSQRLTGMINRENAAALRDLATMIDDGTVTPALDRTFPLEKAAEAMQWLENGFVRGKIAITLD